MGGGGGGGGAPPPGKQNNTAHSANTTEHYRSGQIVFQDTSLFSADRIRDTSLFSLLVCEDNFFSHASPGAVNPAKVLILTLSGRFTKQRAQPSTVCLRLPVPSRSGELEGLGENR